MLQSDTFLLRSFSSWSTASLLIETGAGEFNFQLIDYKRFSKISPTDPPENGVERNGRERRGRPWKVARDSESDSMWDSEFDSVLESRLRLNRPFHCCGLRTLDIIRIVVGPCPHSHMSLMKKNSALRFCLPSFPVPVSAVTFCSAPTALIYCLGSSIYKHLYPKVCQVLVNSFIEYPLLSYFLARRNFILAPAARSALPGPRFSFDPTILTFPRLPDFPTKKLACKFFGSLCTVIKAREVNRESFGIAILGRSFICQDSWPLLKMLDRCQIEIIEILPKYQQLESIPANAKIFVPDLVLTWRSTWQRINYRPSISQGESK